MTKLEELKDEMSISIYRDQDTYLVADFWGYKSFDEEEFKKFVAEITALLNEDD